MSGPSSLSLLACAGLILCAGLPASESVSFAPTRPPPSHQVDLTLMIEQLRQFDNLLQLSTEQLKRLRETIEFIERLAPEEREAMRLRLAQVTRMTPELRAEIDELANLVPPATHGLLNQYWVSLTDAERTAVRDALAAVEPGQRSPILEGHISAFHLRRDAAQNRLRHKQDTTSPAPPTEP